MESGRSGRRGVYVHLHVVEAKERERGHAPPRSTAGGRVKGPRLIISLVILLSAQLMDSGRSGARGAGAQ